MISEPKRALRTKYKCPYCQYKSDRNSRLARHMLSKHNVNLKEQNTLTSRANEVYYVQCDRCEYISTSDQQLIDHVQLKHDKLFPCQHCSHKATRKDSPPPRLRDIRSICVISESYYPFIGL